jgi:hypothetical protein
MGEERSAGKQLPEGTRKPCACAYVLTSAARHDFPDPCLATEQHHPPLPLHGPCVIIEFVPENQYA